MATARWRRPRWRRRSKLAEPRASLHVPACPGMLPGRADLVDAVMDLPEGWASERLEAAVPSGDGESLERLRERTQDTVTRPARSTTLVDADIPAPGQPGAWLVTITAHRPRRMSVFLMWARCISIRLNSPGVVWPCTSCR
jgi:hypothetical protein